MTSHHAALAAALAAIVGLGTAVASAAAPKADKAEAVAFQIDPAHSGDTAMTNFSTPLKLAWNVNLGGQMSYPLIVDGKVFVDVSNQYTTGEAGTTLYALDLKTGAVVWSQTIKQSDAYWSNAAYDKGAIFDENGDGLVRAFDAKTGSQKWSVQLDGDSLTPPVAGGGAVYTIAGNSGGTVYALNEKTGQTVWTQGIDSSGETSPALGGDGLYVTAGCYTYGLAANTGAMRWSYYYGCGGNEGVTPVYTSGLLFARNSQNPDLIFRATNGKVKGVFAANPVPAFFNDANGDLMEATLAGATLYVLRVKTGIVAWSFVGDQNLDSAPIVINGQIVEGSSSGNLYILDGATGNVVWTVNVGSPIYGPDELSVDEPITGLGAGEGTLVVPANFNLAAYVPK